MKNVFCAVTFLHCCCYIYISFLYYHHYRAAVNSVMYLWIALIRAVCLWRLTYEWKHNSHTEKCVRLCAQYDDKYHNSWLDPKKRAGEQASERVSMLCIYTIFSVTFDKQYVYHNFCICVRIYQAQIYICWIFNSIFYFSGY